MFAVYSYMLYFLWTFFFQWRMDRWLVCFFPQCFPVSVERKKVVERSQEVNLNPCEQGPGSHCSWLGRLKLAVAWEIKGLSDDIAVVLLDIGCLFIYSPSNGGARLGWIVCFWSTMSSLYRRVQRSRHTWGRLAVWPGLEQEGKILDIISSIAIGIRDSINM
jgi:hypothetical protein